MKKNVQSAATISTLAFAVLVLSTNAVADQFDFEVAAAFDRTQFEGSKTTTTQGGTVFNSGETDTDELSLFGSWFFAGMSDDKGPRARAVFVDRASSVSIGYSSLDQTTKTLVIFDDPAFPFPDFDQTLKTDGDSFAVDVRYVDRDSGWFGDIGLLTTDVTLSGFVSDSVDGNGWRLGVGKYLFDTTALGLDYSDVDVDGGGGATVIAVSFTHLGDLGSRWQYAVDLGYARSESDFGTELDTWDAAFSLYPTRDFEFGIAIEDVSGDSQGFLDFDTTGITGFASWFVTPNVKLAALYRVDDVGYFGNVGIPGEPTESDADQDSFGLSVAVRF